MRYSALTQRIAGDGAAAWQIHDRALALREQGVDVLLLSIGDPDFDTPQPIVQAAINSLLAGDTHYPAVRGSQGLRNSIARHHRQRSGQAVDALLLNSPNNPSGASLPMKAWKALAELCIRHDLWLISDEVYSELLFEGEHISPSSLPGMAERTATINSLSKSHAMSGWRVGWVIGPKPLCEHLVNLSLCMLFGIPDFIQNAAQLALDENLPHVALMREEYRQRRDLVCASLDLCPGIQAIRPDGGMFVMVDVRQTGLSAQHFAERLLDGYGVSVLAGEAFGPSAAGHIRIGLVVDRPKLADACRRIVMCVTNMLEGRRA